MPSSRRGRQDFILDAARDQRIFDLQIADRMHGGGAADRFGAHLRQADMADIAGLHHVGDGADRLLDRHVRIEPRRPVDIDMVDAEPLQRIGEEVLHRRRPRVEAAPAAGGIAHRAELHAELEACRGGTPFSASPISISLWPMP